MYGVFLISASKVEIFLFSSHRCMVMYGSSTSTRPELHNGLSWHLRTPDAGVSPPDSPSLGVEKRIINSHGR